MIRKQAREQALSPIHPTAERPLSARQRFFSRVVTSRLDGLLGGRVTVFDPGGARSFGSLDPSAPLHATVTVHDPDFYVMAATRGTIGVAEAYMDGLWDCDDLTALIRMMARDWDTAGSFDAGLARWARPFLRAFALAHRNTRRASRANIAAHYDLGNEFFAQFLDETMTYSSAVFENPSSTLKEAQEVKYDRICRKLDIGPRDRVLEIGTGWGGFAVHAASRYGCRVTTTTISAEQFTFAAARVREAGLEDRIELLSRDYRDLEGFYDKIVSIEMIEAVGHEYMHDYLGVCGRRLEPGGACLIQAIVLPDQAFEASKTSVDFIKRYIFPGGSLPSVSSICDAARTATDFRLEHLEDITSHYATTLAHWRRRMHDNLDSIRALGYPERFLRMWEFYLCYCEGGFSERSVNTVQMLFERQGSRRPSPTGRLEGAVTGGLS
ncbi:MAG: class I SAM-dependent methyltransferase [Candidatus Binatia bacterium]